MNYDLEGKVFVSESNTKNGEVGESTVFYYHQKNKLVWADYSGGEIVQGHLIAQVMDSGQLDMAYHHVNRNGVVMSGKCLSTPEITSDGKLKFQEEWKWLTGDLSAGRSTIIEHTV